MAHTYANAHPTMHENKKKCNEDFFENGTTNGAHWYNVYGKSVVFTLLTVFVSNQNLGKASQKDLFIFASEEMWKEKFL